MAQLASLKDYLAMASTICLHAMASIGSWLWTPNKPMVRRSMRELGQTIRDLFQLETPAAKM